MRSRVPLARLMLLSAAALAMLSAAVVPAGADPITQSTELTDAEMSSADDNQAYEANNVPISANVVCEVTPVDAVLSPASFRGAGSGSPQTKSAGETVLAGDRASFQGTCASHDADGFSLTVEYGFEVYDTSGVWSAIAGSAQTCGPINSTPAGTTESVSIQVPGSAGCGSETTYPEGDPSLTRPHRLHVTLTSTAGNLVEGVSKPWITDCIGDNCPPPIDHEEVLQEVTNPDDPLTHCVGLAYPLGTDPNDEDSGETCFDTFEEAVFFATSGRVQLPDGLTLDDLDNWLNQPSSGNEVISIEYNYQRYNPNGGTKIYTVLDDEGCRFGNKYQVSWVGQNWNDRISSSQGYAGCLHNRHYQHSNFNQNQNGASSLCPCPTMGAMNEHTSSIKWRA